MCYSCFWSPCTQPLDAGRLSFAISSKSSPLCHDRTKPAWYSLTTVNMTLQVLAHPGITGICFKNGKLCQELQEQHTSLTNARGTIALSTFRSAKVASFVLSPANLEWAAGLSSTSRLILGSRARPAMRGSGGARGLPRHLAKANPIGLQETSRLKVDCLH